MYINLKTKKTARGLAYYHSQDASGGGGYEANIERRVLQRLEYGEGGPTLDLLISIYKALNTTMKNCLMVHLNNGYLYQKILRYGLL